MDKARRNFDAVNATRDRHGNITAKKQCGLDAKGKPRKSARGVFMDADEKDMLVVKRKFGGKLPGTYAAQHGDNNS